MSRVLHIVEVLPHIYAGSVNKRAEIEGPLLNTPFGYKQDYIPSGGVAFLFNKIYDYGFKDRMVFVADRYPEKKKAMNHDYKANRDNSNKNEIYMQANLAELILSACGFEVLYEEGYEADDLVYELARKYKEHYDKVYIHTGDSDLYICVDDNVEILPASSKGKHITRMNYMTTVLKNSIVPYNSLSFAKVLYGEVGDNIPALPKELAAKIRRALYNDFIFQKMGDREFMRETVKALFPDALDNFDLVYPLPVNTIIDEHKEPDLIVTQVFGRLVGNRKFQKVDIKPPIVETVMAELFAEGSVFIDN